VNITARRLVQTQELEGDWGEEGGVRVLRVFEELPKGHIEPGRHATAAAYDGAASGEAATASFHSLTTTGENTQVIFSPCFDGTYSSHSTWRRSGSERN
jgi:hypothetical protein